MEEQNTLTSFANQPQQNTLTSFANQPLTSVPTEDKITVLDNNTLVVTAFTVSTVSLALTILLSFATICLNFVCLMAMVRGRLFTESNKFIFLGSLATMNVLAGTLSIADSSELSSDDLINDQGTFKYFCLVNMLTSQVVVMGQVYSLLLLTLDQYAQIEKPLRYPIYATRRNALISLAAVALLCVTTVIMLGTFWATPDKGCRYFDRIPLWLAIYYMGIVVPVPLGLIIPIHIRILRIVWKASKRSATLQIKFTPQGVIKPSTSNDSQSARHERGHPTDHQCRQVVDKKTRKDKDVHFVRSQWKSVVTVSVMVGFYLGCWIPASLCSVVLRYDPDGVSPDVMAVTIFLYDVNFLVTPMIFIVRLKEVRKEIKKMFGCKCRCRPRC